MNNKDRKKLESIKNENPESHETGGSSNDCPPLSLPATAQTAARLSAMIQAFDGLIYVCSQDHRIEFMNDHLIRRTGYDGTGKQCYEVLHERDAICPGCVNDRVFSGETVRWETKSPKDNHCYYIINTPIYNEDGTISKQAMIYDITERKQLEEELQANREALESRVQERTMTLIQTNRALKREIAERKRAEEVLKNSGKQMQTSMNASPIPQFVIDRNHRIIHWNQALEQYTGIKADDVIGTTRQWKAFYNHERPCLADLLLDSATDDIKKWYGKEYNHSPLIADAFEATDFFPEIRGGTWLYFTAAPIRDMDGAIIGVLETLVDITKRMQAEEELRKSEEFLNNIIENIPDMIFVKDADELRFVMFNKAGEKLLGYTRNELIGKNDYDFFPKNEADFFTEKDREVLRDMILIDIPEETIQTRLMGERILHTKKIPILDNHGAPRYLLGIAEDITGRKKAEEERIRLATTIEQAAEGIVMSDANWMINYINPSFERMTGFGKGDIIGRHARILKSDKHDRDYYRNIRSTLLRGDVWSGHLINRKKDGTLYDAEVTASPVQDSSGKTINYVSIHRDITHEVKLEKQLRQSQKMEAIGTLAGGIAHDFNNILTAIIGYTDMALFKAPEGNPIRHDLDQVLRAGARAKELVNQILIFSRQTEHDRVPIRINHTVNEALKLLRSSLPTTIHIHQEMATRPGRDTILADPTQMHQVLMNLCTNAAHAMRDHGGMLTVGLSEIEIDDATASQYPDLEAGSYVMLTVGDTGHGIEASVLERIFDPYFTTKRPGEGTGLGLAVVQGIVKNHGGYITVNSEIDVGTTFNVFFPRIEAPMTPVKDASETIPKGNERILFIDDEHVLIDLGKEMLEFLGYTVTTKTNGHDALETFRARPDLFDLVITDMTMPGMTGLDLAKKLMEIKPDLPIILCTGFSELINEKQAKETGIHELVMKPYIFNHLARIIRQVFERSSAD